MSRTILFLELIILCGPAIALLALGTMLLPVSLTALIFSSVDSDDLPKVSFIIISGIWGLVSLTGLDGPYNGLELYWVLLPASRAY